MAINSKQKGARFERLLASKLREYGYDCRRGQQYCGANGDADVVGLPYIHIEAKNQEKMYLYDWIEQAKRDTKANDEERLPAVFHKKNNAEILVTMTFDDFMKMCDFFQVACRNFEAASMHHSSIAFSVFFLEAYELTFVTVLKISRQ